MKTTEKIQRHQAIHNQIALLQGRYSPAERGEAVRALKKRLWRIRRGIAASILSCVAGWLTRLPAHCGCIWRSTGD